MIPVQTIVPRALADILRKAPLTGEKVAFAWRTAVGPAVAGATEVALEDQILRVRTRDGAWQRELERSAAMIRTRLDDLLGTGVVRYIEITAATAAESQSRKRSLSAGGSDTASRRR